MLDHFTIDDFIILIFLRGKIYEIIECLQILQLENIPTLSITDLKTNQLTSYATYNPYHQSLEIVKRLGNDWIPNM